MQAKTRMPAGGRKEQKAAEPAPPPTDSDLLPNRATAPLERALDEALEESFPASDPPARSPAHAGTPPGRHSDGGVSPSDPPSGPSNRR